MGEGAVKGATADWSLLLFAVVEEGGAHCFNTISHMPTPVFSKAHPSCYFNPTTLTVKNNFLVLGGDSLLLQLEQTNKKSWVTEELFSEKVFRARSLSKMSSSRRSCTLDGLQTTTTGLQILWTWCKISTEVGSWLFFFLLVSDCSCLFFLQPINWLYRATTMLSDCLTFQAWTWFPDSPLTGRWMWVFRCLPRSRVPLLTLLVLPN